MPQTIILLRFSALPIRLSVISCLFYSRGLELSKVHSNLNSRVPFASKENKGETRGSLRWDLYGKLFSILVTQAGLAQNNHANIVQNCVFAITMLCDKSHPEECDPNNIQKKCEAIAGEADVQDDLLKSKQTMSQMNSYF